ncbi:MAG: AIR synthase-related protein [bacterium]|nr:AIR synthase-related protein [bacterium]
MDSLAKIIMILRSALELKRKSPIGGAVAQLANPAGKNLVKAGMGEDAGAIRVRGGYILLSADGIWPLYLQKDPFAAGRALVIANTNDIYATGGKPLGLADVISIPNPRLAEPILRGIKTEIRRLRIPVVGGHLHPDAPAPGLAGAAVGFTRHLLLSSGARVGDDIILAMDLRRGRRGKGGARTWDTHHWKKPERLLGDLGLLPRIAGKKLAHAAKDISNGGVITSLGMLLEASGRGAEIRLGSVVRPEKIFTLSDWLLTFPSYGFVLAAPPKKSRGIIRMFDRRGISAAVIGKVLKEKLLWLELEGKKELLFDLKRDPITGIASVQKGVRS